MKKIYLKPEITVVILNVHDNVLQSISGTSGVDGLDIDNDGGTSSGGITDANSREVIRSRSAWEEW